MFSTDAGSGPVWRFVRLDMSATDEPIAALPFKADEARNSSSRSGYEPILSAHGEVLGAYQQSDVSFDANGQLKRRVLQHLDPAGRVLREFSSVTIATPNRTSPYMPETIDIHPFVAWNSPKASVLAVPPGIAGIPSTGGYVLYRPVTQALVTGVLDTKTGTRSPVHPELASPRPLFNRWPNLLVIEADGRLSSIDLSAPGFPIRYLLTTRYFAPQGLSTDTLVVEEPYGTVQVLSLGADPAVRFERSHFLGWSALYPAAGMRPIPLAGQLFSRARGPSVTTPDGEPSDYSVQRSVLPNHFLMTTDDGAGVDVLGVSVKTRATVVVGRLPDDLSRDGLRAGAGYSGRWVVFQAAGQVQPCETRPTWVVTAADGTGPCTQQITDILIADPSRAGSLKRLTDASVSRF